MHRDMSKSLTTDMGLNNAKSLYYKNKQILSTPTKGDSTHPMQGSSRYYHTNRFGRPQPDTSSEKQKSLRFSQANDHYMDSNGAIVSSQQSKRLKDTTLYMPTSQSLANNQTTDNMTIHKRVDSLFENAEKEKQLRANA